MNCQESLALWRTQNEAMTERLLRAVQGLDVETLNRCPDEKTWSPAQVLEHLVVTNRLYLPTISAALASAQQVTGNPPVRLSLIGNFLFNAAGPNGNAPAPKALLPRTTAIPVSIVEEWRLQQEEIAALLDRAAGVDLSRLGVRNPLVGFLRMNVADCFAILTTHTERHIQQIEERIAVVAGRPSAEAKAAR